MKLITLLKNYLNKGHQRSVLAKKQAFISIFYKGFSMVLYLVSVPLLINYLDSERYGVWLTLTSIIAWFSFFDAGLGNGLRNKLSEALANKNFLLAKQYISTTYAILGIIFSTILLIFIILNQYIAWGKILNTAIIPDKELSMLTLTIFSLFFLRFIFKLIGIVLIADQRPAINNAFEPIGTAISLLIIFIISRISKGHFVLFGFIMTFIPLLVLILATIVLFRNRYRNICPSFQSIVWNHSKGLMGLGVKFFFIQIASIILFSSSNIIITQLYGAESVVAYNAAYRYFQIPIMGYSIILIPIWSSVTNAFVLKDFSWIKSTFFNIEKLSILFFILILLMLVFSEKAYDIWLQGKVKIPKILSISMALYATISVFSAPLSQIINGTGKVYLTTIVVAFVVLLYFPLAIFLAKTQLKESGVMFATCIINGIPQFLYLRQVLKLVNNKATGIWNK